MESNYLIRLKFRDKLEFIYFSENDLEYENFLKKGLFYAALMHALGKWLRTNIIIIFLSFSVFYFPD